MNWKVRQLLADIALLAVAFAWGATFQLVQDALSSIDTFPFLAFRFFGALLFLLPFHRGRWHWHYTGIIAGVYLMAGYAFQTFGLLWTTPGNAAFITGLNVVLVPIFIAVRKRRFPGWGVAAGALLAAVGLGLISLHGSFIPGKGDLLALICAVFYALQIIVLGTALKHMPAQDLTMLQLAVVSLLSFACWGAFGGQVHWTAPGIWALLITSLIATAIAFLVQSWAQKFTSPTRVALAFSAEPVCAAIFSFYVGHEVFTAQKLAGCALVFLGIIVGILINNRGAEAGTVETSAGS
jgi:drug/metabolite transporter (DMT)-like permease